MIDVEQHGSVTVVRMARGVLGRPLYWVAAYWLDGLLIDSGPPVTAHELVRVLAQVPVHQIVVTHGHEDHIGGLALLRQHYPDVPIYAPRLTVPLVENPELLGMQRYRRLVWGTPQPVHDVRLLDELDDVVRTPEFTLRVIETPGHSRDHVSYFEPRHRWLFCGDAFIGGRDVAWTPEFDMFGVVSSLRTLASLAPDRIFPGSGSVRRAGATELHGKANSLAQLANEVMKLDGSGHTTGEIVELLFAGEPRMRWWTLGHFSAANLVEACRAYSALVAPADLAPPARPTLSSRERPNDRKDDRTGPSPNRSTDPGDRRR
jgi:glyoxylase-like metal-dependent hydrolase (beta-lactamase superfamily II)